VSDNALATLDFNQLPATSIGSMETFDELSQGADFLGRLQLFGRGKMIDKGLIKPGHWGIPVSADEVIDLGPRVDILVLARRPKAIDMSDKPVVSVYDETDPAFKRIAAESKVKDSGCQFGPSFLVIERTTCRLLELFLGAPTHRPEAKKIYPNMPVTAADIERLKASGADVKGMEPHGPLPMTLGAKYIEREFSWYVPQVFECSTPFTRLPKHETVLAEINKFLTAKSEVSDEESKSEGKKRAR
jgi:hypothetical protein